MAKISSAKAVWQVYHVYIYIYLQKVSRMKTLLLGNVRPMI